MKSAPTHSRAEADVAHSGMTGVVVNVDCRADPPAAELCVSERNADDVILIIHSGRDQIRMTGLPPHHARLIGLAVNAMHEG